LGWLENVGRQLVRMAVIGFGQFTFYLDTATTVATGAGPPVAPHSAPRLGTRHNGKLCRSGHGRHPHAVGIALLSAFRAGLFVHRFVEMVAGAFFARLHLYTLEPTGTDRFLLSPLAAVVPPRSR